MEIIRNHNTRGGVILNGLFDNDRYSCPEDIVNSFLDYIDWLDVNKLKEAKLYGSEGNVTELDRMRIPTIQGFAFHQKYLVSGFNNLKLRGREWQSAFQFIEDTMYALSIEGAAAGLLKESIVMRKLGMADKVDITDTRKRVVIIETPNNQRAIIMPEDNNLIEEAEEVD